MRQQPLKNPFGIQDPFEQQPRQSPFQNQAKQQPIQQDISPNKHQGLNIEMQDDQDLQGNLNLSGDVVQQTKNQKQWKDPKYIPLEDDSGQGFSSVNEDGGDPPLLEDLDITNPLIIKRRVLNVLLFKTFDEEFLENPDLSGPILLGLLLGLSLMLTGKVHFNFIYGFGAAGWLFIFFIMNFMSQDKFIDFYKVVSILGYGLAPIVVISFLNIFFSLKGSVSLFLPFSAIIWSTISAAKTFDFALGLDQRRLLIAYPIFLFYFTFILITIF